MTFEYDTNGQPAGFSYQNAHYYYLTNQMGDVIGIADVNGYAIVYYLYDEWGNLLSIETADESKLAIAEANPLRYRGYYYDTETEYYYLQSRYYDAGICRFINADEPVFLGVGESIAKWNLFSYCENEPVNMSDTRGTFAIPWQIKVGLAAGVASALYEIGKYIAKNFYKSKKALTYIKGLLVAAGKGFVRGFIVGIMSTLPRNWIFGLVGGTIVLLYKVANGQIKKASQAISAFMNGWTAAVTTRTVANLMKATMLELGIKSKTQEVFSSVIDLLVGYGVMKVLSW